MLSLKKTLRDPVTIMEGQARLKNIKLERKFIGEDFELQIDQMRTT